jgi:hypothetical protein
MHSANRPPVACFHQRVPVSRIGPFPVHLTLRPNARCPFLLIVRLVPPPDFRVACYPPLMSDVVLICPHALLGFQVAAQDHAGHLDVAEVMLTQDVVTIYLMNVEISGHTF